MQRRGLGFVAAVLVLMACGSGLALADGHDTSVESIPQVGASTADPPTGPTVWIRIELTPAGHAEWAIESRFNVSSATQQEAFDDLVEDVRAGRTDPGYDRELVDGYRDAAATVVDREMEIVDARWTDRIEGDTGVLAFEFTWTNFAAADGDHVELGDVFATPGGPWLAALDEGTRLTIDAPSGYSVESSPPGKSVDEGRITWDGPVSFSADDFEVTYAGSPGSTTLDWPALAVLGLFGLVVAAALVARYRRDRTEEGETEPELAEVPAVEPTEPAEEPIDEELLSDPERVERLLREHGGRMKQKMIVEETDWSTAKVSKLLSEMADEGRIEKLRIGQENLISLPEDGTDEAG